MVMDAVCVLRAKSTRVASEHQDRDRSETDPPLSTVTIYHWSETAPA